MKRKLYKKLNSFLCKTFEMISDESCDHIVSWTEDGTAFEIKDLPAFCGEVLPSFFKHKNFSSFVRQLNMYDFHKLRDSESHIFSHHLFLRGQKDKLKRIHRKTSEVYPSQAPKNLALDFDSLFEGVVAFRKKHKKLRKEVRKMIGQNQNILKANKALLECIKHSRNYNQGLEGLLLENCPLNPSSNSLFSNLSSEDPFQSSNNSASCLFFNPTNY